MAEHDPDSLKDTFTQTFDLKIKLFETEKLNTIEDIKSLLEKHAPLSNVVEVKDDLMHISVPYRNIDTDFINHSPLMKDLEALENEKRIEHFRIISSNLEEVFHDLVHKPTTTQDRYLLAGISENANGNGVAGNKGENNEHKAINSESKAGDENTMDVIKNLFNKRFLHFKRNFRLIICVLVLPTIFEIIAMGFMKLRPPGEYDINLRLSRELYGNSTEFYRYLIAVLFIFTNSIINPYF